MWRRIALRVYLHSVCVSVCVQFNRVLNRKDAMAWNMVAAANQFGRRPSQNEMHEYSKMSNYTAFSNISRSLSFDRNTTIIYGVYESQQTVGIPNTIDNYNSPKQKPILKKMQNVGLTSVMLMLLCAN